MPVGIGIFILVAIAAVALGILGHLQAKKRREELAGVARELGWEFDPSDDSLHDEQYAQFHIFRRGDRRRAYNTMWGSVAIHGYACPTKAGDFTYKVTSGSGKSRRTTTYRFSYLIVTLPFAHAPQLLVRPEGILDRLAGAVGFDDIDFESAEFSRSFHVTSSDKRFAYDVCHPRMMEFLLATRPPAVEVEHGNCCVSDGSRRWSAGEFHAHVRWIGEFVDRWPDYLKNDLIGGEARR